MPRRKRVSATLEQRQAVARQIVKDSNNMTNLSAFDADLVAVKEVHLEGDGPARAQIRMPLDDPTEAVLHLLLLRNAIDRALLLARAAKTDRAALQDVGSVLRLVNKQINARRQGR
jgi:hypothetical protein